MNYATRSLAAAALAATVLAANAATLIETDYPEGTEPAAMVPTDASGAAVGVGGALMLMHSESAPTDEPLPGYVPPSREEVQQKTYTPGADDFGYFA